MMLLLINNKQKITHEYVFCPFQNGYLERLNDIISQNILGKLFYRFFFYVNLYSLKVDLIYANQLSDDSLSPHLEDKLEM